ncbi:MAG TPA: hypothetical protein VLU25_13540 [Acidobacteriota bacterium]|nr:hypothetical protein [Acidobacteriota bacterium]
MKSKFVGLTLAVLFVAYLLWSSLGLDRVTVEICLDYNGNSACRTASGANQEEAVRTAVDVACAVLAAGRDDSIACNDTKPTSVRLVD